MRLRLIIIVSVRLLLQSSSSSVELRQTAFATSGFKRASCLGSRSISSGGANPTQCPIPFTSITHGRRGTGSRHAACDKMEKTSSYQTGAERKKKIPERRRDRARENRCSLAQRCVLRRGYKQGCALETPNKSRVSEGPATEISTAHTRKF